jgi:hypothetical protein
LGRIRNKYIILDIMFKSFFKLKGINFLLGTSRSFRQLLLENYKAATFMSEDAVDHIELMPFKMSKIDLPGAVDFILLSGDRFYTLRDGTLFVYSVR